MCMSGTVGGEGGNILAYPAGSSQCACSSRCRASRFFAPERRNARSLSSGWPTGSGLWPARWQAPAGPGGLLRPTVLSVPHMTFQPRDHAQHDLFVVFLQNERMAVTPDAGLGEDIDSDIAAGGLEGFLE